MCKPGGHLSVEGREWAEMPPQLETAWKRAALGCSPRDSLLLAHLEDLLDLKDVKPSFIPQRISEDPSAQCCSR